MAYNMNAAMNGRIRRAGGRSRELAPGPMALPNIGQTPAVQAANVVMSQQAQSAVPPEAQPSPMAAPAVQPSTMALHPPGTPADPNQYNYEPQPDGAWRVYPPGVSAPAHTASASLPRAASTADYRRMREAFQQVPGTPPPSPV